MPDLIYAQGPLPVPSTYTVPGTAEIVPLTVSATFDGTSASGSFVACCSFYSQEGHLISRVPTSTTLAAGDSAEVTWAPFLRSAAAAAATSAGVSGDYFINPVSIAGGGFSFVPWTFITGTQVLDLTDPTTPKVTVAGTYAVSACMTAIGAATTNNFFEIDLRWNWPTASNSHMRSTGYAGVLTDQPFTVVAYTLAMAVGDTFRLLVINRDTGTRNFASENVVATRQA